MDLSNDTVEPLFHVVKIGLLDNEDTDKGLTVW